MSLHNPQEVLLITGDKSFFRAVKTGLHSHYTVKKANYGSVDGKDLFNTTAIIIDEKHDSGGVQTTLDIWKDIRKRQVCVPVLFLSFSLEEDFKRGISSCLGSDIQGLAIEPLINFGKGDCYLQKPFKIEKLLEILAGTNSYALPELTPPLEKIALLDQLASDRNFRHRHANVISCIRLLQGAYRAGHLSTQFRGGLEISNLTECANFHGYAKLLVDGQLNGPFTIITIPPHDVRVTV